MHILLSYVVTLHICYVSKSSSSELHLFVVHAAGKTFTTGGWISPAHFRKRINMSNFRCLQYLYQQNVPRYVCRYAGLSPKQGKKSSQCACWTCRVYQNHASSDLSTYANNWTGVYAVHEEFCLFGRVRFDSQTSIFISLFDTQIWPWSVLGG